jgi:hypothetical protein
MQRYSYLFTYTPTTLVVAFATASDRPDAAETGLRAGCLSRMARPVASSKITIRLDFFRAIQ